MADVKTLLQQLQSDDAVTRCLAAARLADEKPLPAEAIQPLLDRLSDEGSYTEDVGDYYGGPWYEGRSVSDGAERALRAADIPDIAPQLLNLLRSGSASARRHAAHLLDACPTAFPALLDAVEDDAEIVRRAALQSLITMQGPRDPLVPRLLDRLWDPDDEVVRLALKGLASMRDDPALAPRIVERMADWDARLRASLNDRRVVATTHRIHVGAALALAVDDEAAAVLTCEILLRDESSTVVGCVAESLCKFSVALPHACVRALFDALHQPRMAHARPWIMPLLARQSLDRASLAREIVQYALDGEPTVVASAPLVGMVSAAACEALKICGEAARACVPALAARLGSDQEAQVERAVAALSSLDALPDVALPPLVAHLRRQSEWKPEVAGLQAIARFGADAVPALPAVIEKLRPRGDFRAVTAAIDTVAAMGDGGAAACPAIARVLLEGDSRVLVIYALQRMGEAARPLRDVLARIADDDADPKVQRLARDTISKW